MQQLQQIKSNNRRREPYPHCLAAFTINELNAGRLPAVKVTPACTNTALQ